MTIKCNFIIFTITVRHSGVWLYFFIITLNLKYFWQNFIQIQWWNFSKAAHGSKVLHSDVLFYQILWAVYIFLTPILCPSLMCSVLKLHCFTQAISIILIIMKCDKNHFKCIINTTVDSRRWCIYLVSQRKVVTHVYTDKSDHYGKGTGEWRWTIASP